jgi:hypothetical protein
MISVAYQLNTKADKQKTKEDPLALCQQRRLSLISEAMTVLRFS